MIVAMAIYHFSAKVISRAKGQSAVAAVSYRTAEKLEGALDPVVQKKLLRAVNEGRWDIVGDYLSNIGKGALGEDAFRRILTHPLLRDKPFILETPMEDDDAAQADIDALKRLSAL